MGRKVSNKPASKTEAITLRVSPQIKYALELLARQYRRTISAVVEEYLSKGLNGEENAIWGNMEHFQKNVWHPDEVQRFLNLASWFDHILTYEEQRIARAIMECSYFHHPNTIPKAALDVTNYRNIPNLIDVDKVRKKWDLLNEIAIGSKDFTDLPK